MKKILGISLCALFAVSAANANIAAQSYVDGINTNLSGLITTNTNNISANTTAIGNNAAAISENAGDISDNATAINGLTTSVNGHNTRITANEGAITGLTTSVAGHDTLITGLRTDVDDNAEDISTNAGKIAAINNVIEQWDDDVSENHFIKGIVQANGKVTATGKNFETTFNAGTNDNAPTSMAVATYVTGQVNDINSSVGDLEGRVAQNETDIEGLETRVDENEANIEGLQGTVTEHGTSITNNATAITGINDTIAGMDFGPTDGQYVKVVSQANGTIEATGASFDTSISDQSTDTNAPTSKAVATYVGGAITGVTNNLGALARKNTVGTTDIDNVAVTEDKIADDAVTTAKIANDAVTVDQIATGAVTDDGLANNAVTTDKIVNDTIMNADINANADIAISKIDFTGAQENALNSGITGDLVAQIGTNQTNIGTLKTTVDQHHEILKPSSACSAADNSAGCTLVIKNGTFSWEAVKR